jgi:hypothetical protein
MSWRFPTLNEIVGLMRGIPIPIDTRPHKAGGNYNLTPPVVALIPTLASNTPPANTPLVLISATANLALAWNATNGTGWSSSTPPNRVELLFVNPVAIYMYTCSTNQSEQIDLQGSTDGVNWVTVDTFVGSVSNKVLNTIYTYAYWSILVPNGVVATVSNWQLFGVV